MEPPIQTIPSEILSEIFIDIDNVKVLGASSQTQVHRSGINSVGHRLGLVCRRWRSVTLSTPQLWASIEVEITPRRYSKGVLTAFRTMLSRSGNTKLTIIIRLDDNLTRDGPCLDIAHAVTSTEKRPRNSPQYTPASILRLLLGQAERIGTLTFQGHENYDGVLDALVLPLLRHFHGRLQGMSCLTINIPVFGHNEETLSNMSFIVQNVPSIRELGLQLNRPSPGDMSHFTCSLTHLTQLHVRDTTVECVWYLLQRCPNLQTALFTLGSTLEPRRWSENTYDVCCNHLHTLSISYDQCYDREDPDEGDDVSNDSGDSDDYLVSSPFLDFISLPNLTNMTIGTAWSDDPYYHADPDLCYFTPLATRNSAGIQALTLDKFPAAAFEMEKLYHQLPNLRYLDIIEARWTDHGSVIKNYTVESRFLDAMKHTSIFPKLEELRLYVNHDWEGSSAFEEMVERRRFKNMYLEIRNRSVDNLDLPRLRELVAKGQMVTVKCESAIEGKLYTLV